VLSVENWAEIRRLHFAEGLGIKTIARHLGVARNTVRIAVRSGQPPAYRRPRRPSAVDPYEDQIRALLKDCPTMPATVIAERMGWRRGITILKRARRRAAPPLSAPRPLSAHRLSTRRARPVGSVGAAGRYPGRLRIRPSRIGLYQKAPYNPPTASIADTLVAPVRC
jgi:transposase